MKDIIKSVWLLVLGLFTAVLLYPALHEFGHSLAAVLFGGKVVEFHLFPLPNILCEVSSVGDCGLIVIGFCGTLIPFLVSAPFSPKSFTVWYVLQVIKGITVLSFGISLVSLFGQRYGIFAADDDIINILKFYPFAKPVFLTVICILMFFAVYSICKQSPLKRIYEYFS